MCHVLEVGRSSFYKWRASAPARAERAAADTALAERIGAIHAEHAGIYEVPGSLPNYAWETACW